MDCIPAPITENVVVRKTLELSQEVANKMGQPFAVTSYDLAVASKAYQIQAIEAPYFDDVFVLMGAFHMEIAFFGAVGTFIEDSGIENILTNAGILAGGSVVGFLKGKHYNRCVRVHNLLATSLEFKLFQKFLCGVSEEEQSSLRDLLEIPSNNFSDLLVLAQSTRELNAHMKKFEEYLESTMKGEHGPTAAYWATYVYMINRLYREFVRCIRMNDLENYKQVLPYLNDVFFGLNRPNYARYTSLLIQKLRNAPSDCVKILKNGAFSVRRTDKNYSRSPVDLVLEQSINKDAASTSKGIVSFHNSHDLIRKWCASSAQRGLAFRELKDMCGFSSQPQALAQIRSYVIDKDHKQIDSLNEAFVSRCDPFNVEEPNLLNISSGRVAAQDTQDYLLSPLKVGRELQNSFLVECQNDESRFLKPMKRRKVKNFSTQNSASGPKVPKPLQNAESLRDIFIHLLFLVGCQSNVDMTSLFSYPLTVYPLSISQCDGSMTKTSKATLTKKLEGFQEIVITDATLPEIQETIIDGGLFIHSQLYGIGRTASYGVLANKLWRGVLAMPGHVVHVLFDTYVSKSLKQHERDMRGEHSTPSFVITGPDQAPQVNIRDLLANMSFKEELPKFLMREWSKDVYLASLLGKTVYVSHGGSCIKLSQAEHGFRVDHPVSYQAMHEEADTLVAYHAAQSIGNVLVRASDADVLMILLHMIAKHQQDQEHIAGYEDIIMDYSVGNTRRYIHVNQICRKIESKCPGSAQAVIALHAMTGSDYTAAFYRKGKVSALNQLLEDDSGKFASYFRSLSCFKITDIAVAEEFVCKLYGSSSINEVNLARAHKVRKATGFDGKEEASEMVLRKISKVDCSLLPPCSKVLKKKMLRVNYVSQMLGNADQRNPTESLSPVEYGYKETDRGLEPVWYDGPFVPSQIEKLEDSPAIERKEDEIWSDDSDEENCHSG